MDRVNMKLKMLVILKYDGAVNVSVGQVFANEIISW